MINEKKKAVTARFELGDYLRMQREAEVRGGTVADVLRLAWNQYLRADEIVLQLEAIERRQRSMFFEMICIAMGMSSAEKQTALAELKERGVTW